MENIMFNIELSDHLTLIADLRGIGKPGNYNTLAYENAAASIRKINNLTPDDDFTTITGVGKAINNEILNFIKCGNETNQYKRLIKQLNKSSLMMRTKEIDKLADSFKNKIFVVDPNSNSYISGDIRRGRKLIHSITIVTTADPKLIIKWINGAGKLFLNYYKNNKLICYYKPWNTRIAVYFTTMESRASCMLMTTGPSDFVSRLTHIAREKGFLLNNTGLHPLNNIKQNLFFYKEHEYFSFLGIDYVFPQNRI